MPLPRFQVLRGSMKKLSFVHNLSPTPDSETAYVGVVLTYDKQSDLYDDVYGGSLTKN